MVSKETTVRPTVRGSRTNQLLEGAEPHTRLQRSVFSFLVFAAKQHREGRGGVHVRMSLSWFLESGSAAEVDSFSTSLLDPGSFAEVSIFG